MKTKIGVSGDAGSFSEEAGLLYAMRSGIDAEIIYAIDMEGVLSLLDKDEIDIGVFPVVNSRGGLVQMAFKAIGRHIFEYEDEIWLEVRHCILCMEGVDKTEIRKVATHPQAIIQCERYLHRYWPEVELIDWDDTAKAAKDLSEGKLDKSTAVIASESVSKMYGLQVLEKGIQDNRPNLTTFITVKKEL